MLVPTHSAEPEALPHPPSQPAFLEYTPRLSRSSRVAICRAMIGRPDLLLADEPTSQLDAESVWWRSSISVFSERRKEQQGWLTQAEAANRLSISAMNVTRLVRSGELPAEQPGYGLPAVITASDLDRAAVQRSVVQRYG